MKRLNLVMRGRMPLTRATIPASRVRLFNEHFTSKLDKQLVRAFAEDMASHPCEILVYWDGSHFIASDDYYPYTAYTILSAPSLPAVIMGEFPEGTASAAQRGGQELLPPVGISRKRVTPGVTPELLDWQAKEMVQRGKRLPPPSDLMANWILFAEVLAEEDVNERALHDFLDENPIMIGAHWDSVEAEVWFGSQYKADFVLRAFRALPTVRLVELERSSHRLFTKDGRETAEVTHAVQQVSDWLRWWRQHPDDGLVAPSRGVDPDGLVIIGRSARLSEPERETLAHNNQRREIKVITYDELLDDFGSLILHRLDDTRT